MDITAVILAADQGTRMHSKLPKALHLLLGRPMVHFIKDAAQQVTGSKPMVIVGYRAEMIQEIIGDGADYVLQEPQLGTGHAVQQAEQVLSGQTELVLVVPADMPLLTAETLGRVVSAQKNHEGPITMLTMNANDSRGNGRVVRNKNGQVVAIVDEARATPGQLAIQEYTTGVYCFTADWLWKALRRVPRSLKGEYFLTDVVKIAVADGLPVQVIVLDNPQEAIGIDTRLHLAEAEALLRTRINSAWMLAGVTLVDPATTYIEPGVTIGQDTVIWPNTYLHGNTIVGQECALGPNTIIRNTRLGNYCKVFASVLEDALLEDNVDIGPYGHLRKGAHLAQGVHMGNFGEVKNSYLGPGTKMGHFSYLGDATVGSEANIGAGTITCNYDGEKKYPTEIGAGVFLGSDTMLVAPVKIGEGARTGAGAVVTKDVPDQTLVVGVPAHPVRKLEKRD
jgi:bifunctional UDP-N-acetylglucosamine pyrophosphorylase/glucosamine-1-phosphate N-acetyltransferase